MELQSTKASITGRPRRYHAASKQWLYGLVTVTGLALGIAGCNQSAPTPTPDSSAETQAITPTADFQEQAQLSESQGQPTATPRPSPAVETSDPTQPTSRLVGLRGSGGGGFVPLDNTAFIKGSEASFLGDDELILGYVSQGEARAYPVKMMRYHHIANDTVNGLPVLITY